jgi:hypothetical protein
MARVQESRVINFTTPLKFANNNLKQQPETNSDGHLSGPELPQPNLQPTIFVMDL